MKRIGRGFTLIELVVVLFVTSVIMAMAFYGYNSLVPGQLSVSNHVRSLAIALQQARMRALAGKTYAEIRQHQSSDWDAGLNVYKTVRFTSTNHGFDPGDYVTFAGLTQAHTGMNGGAYEVTSDGINADNFECLFYHPPPLQNVTEPAPDPVTKLPPYPKASNLSSASRLVIMKLSSLSTSTDPNIVSYMSDEKNKELVDQRPNLLLLKFRSGDYYVYRDGRVVIWNEWDTVLDKPKEVATLAFDSRGFTLNPDGYTVWVSDTTRVGMATRKYSGEVVDITYRSMVSVSPFGIVRPGS